MKAAFSALTMGPIPGHLGAYLKKTEQDTNQRRLHRQLTGSHQLLASSCPPTQTIMLRSAHC